MKISAGFLVRQSLGDGGNSYSNPALPESAGLRAH